MNQVALYNHPASHMIMAQEDQFNSVLSDDRISFKKEAQFALQILQNNDFLAKKASSNQNSFLAAIHNVAAIGISLNPASKHAYLVPRGNQVCLDVSYMGLLHIATESGSILWAQCKLVYSGDDFEMRDIDQKPHHHFNPFNKDRGSLVGAYCVAKTHDGSFLTEAMSMDEINVIKKASKANNGPWVSYHDEMVRKTVIKRAYKYWPKTDRMTTAIDALNQHEGIDFESERRQVMEDADPSVVADINQAIQILGIPMEAALKRASSICKRNIEGFEGLSKKEAGQLLSMLKQRIDQEAAKQEQDNF